MQIFDLLSTKGILKGLGSFIGLLAELYQEINDLVLSCGICQEFRNYQSRETLLTCKVSNKSGNKVGRDLHNSFKGQTMPYLIVVEYVSKFFKVGLLSDTHSSTVFSHNKYPCTSRYLKTCN